MSESKHTPGPWEVSNDGIIHNGKDRIAQIIRSDDYESNDEANAVLIASAPDQAFTIDRQAEQIQQLKETIEQTLNTINGLGGIPNLDRNKLQNALRTALVEK